MPESATFEYDFKLPLSKYNTLRYEDRNRQRWQEENVGEFVRNDRFCCEEKPKFVEIVIRKTYKIPLQQRDFFMQFIQCINIHCAMCTKSAIKVCANCLLTNRQKCGIIWRAAMGPNFQFVNPYTKQNFKIFFVHSAQSFPKSPPLPSAQHPHFLPGRGRLQSHRTSYLALHMQNFCLHEHHLPKSHRIPKTNPCDRVLPHMPKICSHVPLSIFYLVLYLTLAIALSRNGIKKEKAIALSPV